MKTDTLFKTLNFCSIALFICVGCNKVNFAPIPSATGNNSNSVNPAPGSSGATDPGSGSSNPGSGSTTTPGGSSGPGFSSPPNTPPPICQPFAGGTTKDPGQILTGQNGIEASITYIPSTSPVVANQGAGLTVASFQPGQPDVITIPNPVFLNQLSIFTQDFSLGFQTLNGYINDINGNRLVQYFSLHMPGSIVLNNGDTPDTYQFALLSDDGATMSVADSSGNLQPFINNDGTRSNTLRCASNNLQLKIGQPLNYKIDYFQGPPVRIALVLLWRHGASVNLNETHCGVEEDDSYFFTNDPNTDLPVATSNWTNMLSQGGWEVVPASNFTLPSGVSNPCP